MPTTNWGWSSAPAIEREVRRDAREQRLADFGAARSVSQGGEPRLLDDIVRGVEIDEEIVRDRAHKSFVAQQKFERRGRVASS